MNIFVMGMRARRRLCRRLRFVEPRYPSPLSTPAPLMGEGWGEGVKAIRKDHHPKALRRKVVVPVQLRQSP